MGLPLGTHALGQLSDVVDGDRLAPIAVAADPDRFIAGPVERQGLGPLEAARAVEADRLGGTRGRRGHRRPVRGCCRPIGADAQYQRDQRNDDRYTKALHLVGRIRGS